MGAIRSCFCSVDLLGFHNFRYGWNRIRYALCYKTMSVSVVFMKHYRWWHFTCFYVFKRTTKTLMRLIFLGFFLSFTVSKSFYYVVIFCETYLVTPKITPDVNNYAWFLHVVQDLGSSLHVRRYFWYLIMTLCQVIV